MGGASSSRLLQLAQGGGQVTFLAVKAHLDNSFALNSAAPKETVSLQLDEDSTITTLVAVFTVLYLSGKVLHPLRSQSSLFVKSFFSFIFILQFIYFSLILIDLRATVHTGSLQWNNAAP